MFHVEQCGIVESFLWATFRDTRNLLLRIDFEELLMFPEYDVIVVGAGHAGCEAAHAAATMGSKTLLVTMNMNTIAQMSCNPAMGGVAKGQIVREIDALGGMSGIISDKSMIQFRMLNRSKGPAMWSPRTQNDRFVFSEEWRLALERTPNVDFWQEMVREILVKDGRAVGIKTSLGLEIKAKAVVLTNGTFLNGKIHIGEKELWRWPHRRKRCYRNNRTIGFTGLRSRPYENRNTSRIDGRSLDYSKMEEQPGDENPSKFSYSDETAPLQKQVSCWITYTNDEVHQTLQKGFEKSPMFQEQNKRPRPPLLPIHRR